MKQAVLAINYKVGNTLLYEPQGKFYYLNSKPTFLVNLNPNKLFKKYNAWGIADQIIKAFRKTKTYPQIIYREILSDTAYLTNLSTITGRHAAYEVVGGHSQWFLPRPCWQAKDASSLITDEPTNFPEMHLDKWVKTVGEEPNKTMSLFSDTEDNEKSHKDYIRAQFSY